MLYIVTFIGGAISMLFTLFIIAKIKLKKKGEKNLE